MFVIYCAVTLLVAVGAFNASNNLLFWLFGLSLGMLLVSGVISGVMMMSLTVGREPLPPARVGEPLRIRYRVTNRSRWLPAFGLYLYERTGSSLHSGKSGTLSGAPSGTIAHVAAKTSTTIETIAIPTQRGRLCLTGFEVTTTFPFGFIRKCLSFDDPAELIIEPGHEPTAGSLLNADKGLIGSGVSAERAGRIGDEPVGLREYSMGDPANLVAWKASARRTMGDLVVRQNAEGTARRLWVVLELSSRRTPQETERAIAVAASLLRAGSGRHYQVGLSVRTDWPSDWPGATPGFDIAPGLGASVMINDLAILNVPPPDPPPPTVPQGESRLSRADIIVDVQSDGTARRRARSSRGGAA